MGLLPQQTPRLLRVSCSGLGEIRTGRIYEHADRGGVGNHFVQQLKLLRHQEGVEIAYPCDVPAWSIEAGDKPKLYGIGPSLEHDRNCRGRSLGSECGRGAGPGDHSDPPANKISGQGRQSIVVFLRPAVFDRDIPPLDIAGFLKTFTEGSHKERVSSGCSAAEKPDHRHRRLLRARRQRPRRRGADECDELAAFHVWMAPAWQEIIWRAAQRSLAVMCPACWCSPGGLLALMGSANRVLIIRTGSMSR